MKKKGLEHKPENFAIITFNNEGYITKSYIINDINLLKTDQYDNEKNSIGKYIDYGWIGDFNKDGLDEFFLIDNDPIMGPSLNIYYFVDNTVIKTRIENFMKIYSVDKDNKCIIFQENYYSEYGEEKQVYRSSIQWNEINNRYELVRINKMHYDYDLSKYVDD